MKALKYILLLLAVLWLHGTGFAQAYFQATLQAEGNQLVIRIKAVNGALNGKRFSAMEFFLRYPSIAPPFSFGTPVTDPAFAGMNFTVKGPNLYGAEPGYTNYVLEWIGGATAIPAIPTNFAEAVEYTVCKVPLLGMPNTTAMELLHNTTQSPTYINISDNLGNSLSCLDNLGNTLGNAFYGPGFYTTAASGGGINHILPLASVPIPVHFIEFTAHPRGSDAVLNWKVTGEDQHTETYQIERSWDGQKFAPISAQPARKAPGEQTYYFTDPDATQQLPEQKGPVFYRIRQTETGTTYRISDIRRVSFNHANPLAATLGPNPAQTSTILRLYSNQEKDLGISIFNQSGQEIWTRALSKPAGTFQLPISLNGWPAGTYRLRITADQQTLSLPFQVIQHP